MIHNPFNRRGTQNKYCEGWSTSELNLSHKSSYGHHIEIAITDLKHRTRTSTTAVSDRRMGQRRRKVVAGSEEKLCKVDKAAIFRHWSAHWWLQHSFMESTSDPAQFFIARRTSNSASNQAGHTHTWYLSRTPRVYLCKFFLASVNFYRFHAKIGNLLCILP